MKVVIDPMPQLREEAERRVNGAFAARPQDIEHTVKRTLAAAVIAGATATPDFQAAADVEGVDALALAKTIMDKPDEIVARANLRRKFILAVRAAKTGADIEAVLVQAQSGQTS